MGLTGLAGLTWDIPHQRGFLSLFSIVAVTLLVLGLTAAWVPGIAWALAVLGVQYWARLALDPAGTALWAPLFGAGLLLCAETAYLSLEIREEGRARLRGRLLTVTLLALGGAVAGELALLAAALLPARGFVLVVAGTAAVAALLAGLVVIAGRAGPEDSAI